MKRIVSILAALLCAAALCLPVATHAGQGIAPGYTREEPGYWALTDTLRVDDPEPERTAGECTIRTERVGEKRDITYTFTVTGDVNESGQAGHSCKGEEARFTVEFFDIPERVYAGSVSVSVNIWRKADTDHTPGDITAALMLGDVERDAGKYGIIPTARQYCTDRHGTQLQAFGVGRSMEEATGYNGEKHYLRANAVFWAGQKDGEQIYLVLEVWDSANGESRMFTACQYTWVDEPVTIEILPQPGPIEYSPLETIGNLVLLAAAILVPAALVILAIVLIVRHRRRKRSQQ